MFKKIALTAIALSLSAPAFAMTDDQLARSVGVEPGIYTVAQLGELSSATEVNDYNRLINFYDTQEQTSVSRTDLSSNWVAAPKNSIGNDR